MPVYAPTIVTAALCCVTMIRMMTISKHVLDTPNNAQAELPYRTLSVMLEQLAPPVFCNPVSAYLKVLLSKCLWIREQHSICGAIYIWMHIITVASVSAVLLQYVSQQPSTVEIVEFAGISAVGACCVQLATSGWALGIQNVLDTYALRRRNHDDKNESTPKDSQLKECDDQLQMCQSQRGLFLRAARLLLMQQRMDRLPAKLEADILVNSVNHRWGQVPSPFSTKSNIYNATAQMWYSFRYYWYSHNDALTAFHAIDLLRQHHKHIIIRRLRDSRKQAEMIRQWISSPAFDDRRRDDLLLRAFVSHYFSGCDAAILKRLLLSKVIDDTAAVAGDSKYLALKVTLSMMGLLALLAGSIILQLQMIDSHSLSRQWVMISGLALLLLWGAALPMKILFLEIFCPQLVHSKFNKLLKVMSGRFFYVMKRSTGLVCKNTDLVQHFHPACRAARLLPGLSMSRLLIALGDFDLPNSVEAKWRPNFIALNWEPGSPLLIDFLRVCAVNFGRALLLVIWLVQDNAKLLCKFLLNSILLLSNEFINFVLDSLFTSYLAGFAIIACQSNSFRGVLIWAVVASVPVATVAIVSFEIYWWYPYVELLWKNDLFTPTRKRYSSRTKRSKNVIKVYPKLEPV